MPVRSDDRDTKQAFNIMRVIVIISILVFDIYAAFFKPVCGIDAEFMSCQVTGSVGDVCGFILLHAGILAMTGWIKPLNDMVTSVGSKSGAWPIIALVVGGALLILFA